MLLLPFLAGCLINTELYERRKEELTDHDGDGYAQEDDCDDTNPAIAPGMEERCDGIDQDCDGEVDESAVDAPTWYPDADGDGHGVIAGSRTQCQSPGADYSDLPDDCDDTNAGAYPGATEIPYDGVDQDCDGADLDDLDGDGWSSDLVGGGDCDDDDPLVNPDMEETWADGLTDNDCDGELEAIQVDYGANAWAGLRGDDGLGRRVAVPGDIDGDGLDEVIVGSELDSTLGTQSGALYLVGGAPGGFINGEFALLPVTAGQYFAAGLDAGRDVSGDGVGDVVVTSMGTAETPGEAWIVDGARWAAAGSTNVDAVELGHVTAGVAGTYGPGSVRFLGDITGDGVEDVGLGECCSDRGSVGSVGRVAVFSTDSFAGSLDDADVIIEGPFTDAYFGYAVDRIGDQDGDGLAELLVSATGGLVGAVVPGTRSGVVLDVATTLIYGEMSGTTVRNVLDVDGDERDDVAVIGQENVVSFLAAIGSTPTRVVETPTFTFTWSEHSGVYDVLPLGDRDGDGRSETLIPMAWSDSGTQRLWVLQGSEFAAGGTLDASDVTLSGVSSVPAALIGYSMALAGDVDGDGHDDAVLGVPEYSSGAHFAGGATLVTVPE
jgi:hypothetical protein